MDSSLTAFEHGVSAHGGRMLNRRTVCRAEVQLHKQTWADAFACPASIKHVCLLAVPIERSASTFIRRVFLPYVRRLAPSLRATNYQIAR